ncbi:hypothetical protein FXN61_12635 [Lentzea sp. PSKA42]|uniref:Uncharacterized protein n=1 Tax=Lentzea indica TaxID=2604800 RepID=A0ABX1FFA0_9PSEU|nr:hypothetical protein [Lentzea indica]NKE57636.1 hypothetical protein [Lentzea indica]
MLAPGVAVLLGYVLLVGNPWLNRDLIVALSDADSALRLVTVMFSYPSWHVDVDLVGPFLFWFANMRAVLFVALAVAGLNRMSRWVSVTAGGTALFVTTVGLTTLSAVVAELGSAAVGLALLDERSTSPYYGSDRPDEFFLNLFSASATFGVLFGLVLGAVVVSQRRNTVSKESRVTAPKSFW